MKQAPLVNAIPDAPADIPGRILMGFLIQLVIIFIVVALLWTGAEWLMSWSYWWNSLSETALVIAVSALVTMFAGDT